MKGFCRDHRFINFPKLSVITKMFKLTSQWSVSNIMIAWDKRGKMSIISNMALGLYIQLSFN